MSSKNRIEIIAMSFMWGVFKTPEEAYNAYSYNGRHLYTLEFLTELYNEVMEL